MEKIKTINKDIIVLKRKVFTDDRGDFIKVFDDYLLDQSIKIKQINQVSTTHKGTFRGFHFQKDPFEELKIFQIVSGSIQLCFMDMREDEKSYLSSNSIILSNKDICILVPKGYATGYLTLEDNSIVLYMSDEKYQPEFESGVNVNDPVVKINWSTSINKLSEKDKCWRWLEL